MTQSPNNTNTLNYLDLSHPTAEALISLGIENLLNGERGLIEGKRLGLITNTTGVDAKLESSCLRLFNHSGCELKAIFTPEQGLWGRFAAGVHIKTAIDPITHLPMYNLYGDTRKPPMDWLTDLDALVYDLQDIGNRSYTFIYTMALAMEAAREAGLPFIVLDRPNPMGGALVDGNVLDPDRTRTFVGLYAIPYIYGLTCGELAQLINDEFGIGCDLHVVKMGGWKRDMMWWNTGLRWIPPSPNLPQPETTFFIAMTGILGEMQTVCEGVGTTQPFQVLGAPWMGGFQLAEALNALELTGLRFRPIVFKPRFGAFMNQECHGVQIHIMDYRRVQPVTAGIHIIATCQKLWPDQSLLGQTSNTVRVKMFNAVMGTDEIRSALLDGATADEICNGWQERFKKYLEIREKVLMYE